MKKRLNRLSRSILNWRNKTNRQLFRWNSNSNNSNRKGQQVGLGNSPGINLKAILSLL